MRRPAAGGRADFRSANPQPPPLRVRLHFFHYTLYIFLATMGNNFSSPIITRWYGPGLMRLLGLLGLLGLLALSTTV